MFAVEICCLSGGWFVVPRIFVGVSQCGERRGGDVIGVMA